MRETPVPLSKSLTSSYFTPKSPSYLPHLFRLPKAIEILKLTWQQSQSKIMKNRVHLLFVSSLGPNLWTQRHYLSPSRSIPNFLLLPLPFHFCFELPKDANKFVNNPLKFFSIKIATINSPTKNKFSRRNPTNKTSTLESWSYESDLPFRISNQNQQDPWMIHPICMSNNSWMHRLNYHLFIILLYYYQSISKNHNNILAS